MTNEIEKIATDLATRAAGIVVADQGSANRATELILVGKDVIKKIKAFFAPLKESAKAAHQGLVDKEKAELAKVEPVVNTLSQRVSNWRAEEQRKRDAAEAERLRIEREKKRLEEEALRKAREAEEKAERERQRLEQQVERLRQEAAKNADNEISLRRIEEEREKLRLQAEENRKCAEEATNQAIDEAAKAEAAMTPAPVVPEAPKTEGLAMRIYWRVEVVDIRALIQAVTEDKVAVEAIVPNIPYLNDLAGRLKGQVQIPGVRFYSETKMASVGKRS
jgi:DNA repair exonuclease SbcCD ATPase subunit